MKKLVAKDGKRKQKLRVSYRPRGPIDTEVTC